MTELGWMEEYFNKMAKNPNVTLKPLNWSWNSAFLSYLYFWTVKLQCTSQETSNLSRLCPYLTHNVNRDKPSATHTQLDKWLRKWTERGQKCNCVTGQKLMDLNIRIVEINTSKCSLFIIWLVNRWLFKCEHIVEFFLKNN